MNNQEIFGKVNIKAIERLMIFPLLFYFGCTIKQQAKNISDAGSARLSDNHSSNIILYSSFSCDQHDLSKQFDITLKFFRFRDTVRRDDSCQLNVLIKDKHNPTILDSFLITSMYYFEDIFSNCNNMTSYATGFNSQHKVTDNYFGDIVISDFNFDGKDDVAVINSSGGNGGPAYNFYIQGAGYKFLVDKYLTDSVAYFPLVIEKVKKRLITYVHAGACCTGEDIYQLNKVTGNWSHISHRKIENQSE